MMPLPAGTSRSWRTPAQSPRPPRSGYWPRCSSRTPARPGCWGDVAGQVRAVRARASLTGQFASVDEDPTGAENLVMIARLLGHPRWRAKTRAGELREAFGLAEAAGRSRRTRAVCAGGWPSRRRCPMPTCCRPWRCGWPRIRPTRPTSCKTPICAPSPPGSSADPMTSGHGSPRSASTPGVMSGTATPAATPPCGTARCPTCPAAPTPPTPRWNGWAPPRIKAALWTLPASQRIAITLMGLRGFTATQVAAITGAPRWTVPARVHRGRKTLALSLAGQRQPARPPGVPR